MMKAMNVCHILYSGLGGVGGVVFALLDGGGLQQWDNQLFFIGNTDILADYQAYCQQHALPYQGLDIRQYHKWATWQALYQGLKQQRPALIYLHSVSYILPVKLYCWRFHARCICVEHTAIEAKPWFDYLFSALAQGLADRVISLTVNFQQQLANRLGWLFRPAKNRVIATGVNLQKFAYRPPQAPAMGQPLRIGMASRFTASKRHDLLLEMMSLLQTCSSPSLIQLSLAGDGETAPWIQQQITTLGLNTVVYLTGALAEAELINWYASLDIYLQASSAEILCTALLQALACGVPIIASDIPGIRGMLNTEIACLVDNSALAFQQAVLSLAIDYPRRQTLSAKGRLFCEQYYSNTRMFSRYHALTQEIIT